MELNPENQQQFVTIRDSCENIVQYSVPSTETSAFAAFINHIPDVRDIPAV